MVTSTTSTTGPVAGVAPAVTTSDGAVTQDTAYWQAEAKKAFAKRDETSKALAEMQTKQSTAEAEQRKLALENAGIEALRKRVGELEPIALRYASVEASMRARLDSQIALLPPNIQAVVPKGVPVEELAAFVEAITIQLRTATATIAPAASATGGAPAKEKPFNAAETLAAMHTAHAERGRNGAR